MDNGQFARELGAEAKRAWTLPKRSRDHDEVAIAERDETRGKLTRLHLFAHSNFEDLVGVLGREFDVVAG